MIAVCFYLGLINELCRAVRAVVELGHERADGRTYRQFLESISDVSDVDEKLGADRVSRGAEYLWETFWEIKSACGNGMSNAVTWSVLLDWATVTRTELRKWQIRAIIAMDREFREVHEELRSQDGH